VHFFHWWKTVPRLSIHTYQECTWCGKRRVIKASNHGHQPIDTEWLHNKKGVIELEKIMPLSDLERTPVQKIAHAIKRLHEELMEKFDDEVYVQKLVIAATPSICERIVNSILPFTLTDLRDQQSISKIKAGEVVKPLGGMIRDSAPTSD
jgi:hypothetical protein